MNPSRNRCFNGILGTRYFLGNSGCEWKAEKAGLGRGRSETMMSDQPFSADLLWSFILLCPGQSHDESCHGRSMTSSEAPCAGCDKADSWSCVSPVLLTFGSNFLPNGVWKAHFTFHYSPPFGLLRSTSPSMFRGQFLQDSHGLLLERRNQWTIARSQRDHVHLMMDCVWAHPTF